MMVILNGQQRDFPALAAQAHLSELIAMLGLKGDRVAVEHNGSIAARSTWESLAMAEGDRLEIVHFVGGGWG